MRLEALAVALPEVAGHPNRVPFEGVLTLVDEPSNRPPSGARGHRVILTRAAALAALPSLMGMAVDYAPGWDGHDARRKCGIITQADVEGNRLRVSGYLFGKDFPEVEERMRIPAGSKRRSTTTRKFPSRISILGSRAAIALRWLLRWRAGRS